MTIRPSSLALLLGLAPGAALISASAAQDNTTLVSWSSSAGPGNADSDRPVVSDDGRYVIFQSLSDAFVAGDGNGVNDIYRRDMQTGEVELVSRSLGGSVAGNGASTAPRCSADGEVIVFQSVASNLVPGDSNGFSDVFVRDMGTQSTRRVSLMELGVEADQPSVQPSLSRDGRYVVFESLAELTGDDLHPGTDVYRVDLDQSELRLVSGTPTGAPSNGFSVESSVSDDGRFVAFRSFASNLAAGDTNGREDVFVRDMDGVSFGIVSASDSGLQHDGSVGSPGIAGDASRVVFTSRATNLVPGVTTARWRTFIKDMATAELELVTRATDGSPSAAQVPAQLFARVSQDGSLALFHSDADDLSFGDVNDKRDVFVTEVGARVTEIVSVTPSGVPSSAASQRPAMSSDGRFVVFMSRGSDLVPGVAGSVQQIYLRDRFGPGGVGTSFCAFTPNSSGLPGRLSATGSPLVAENDLALAGQDLPTGTFGFFITSRVHAPQNLPGSVLGQLCLGSSIGRFVGPGEVQSTGAAGTMSVSVNLTAIPQPQGPRAAVPGETWFFQAWTRDSLGGQATSIVTDALAVTFR